MAIIAKKVTTDDSLAFNWADETITIVDLDKIPEAMKQRAMIHGLSQKLGDSYSGADGNITTAKEMFNATLEGLEAGDWNRKGGGSSSGGIWIEAIAQATGESIEHVLGKWNEMDEATKKATQKHPDVIEAQLQIKLARLQAKVKASDAAPLTI